MGEPNKKLQYMLNQLNLAYRTSPKGTWAQRWIPGVCKHLEVRCTHGDEIIGRNYSRRVCLICGRSLKGKIPTICFFNGEPHK